MLPWTTKGCFMRICSRLILFIVFCTMAMGCVDADPTPQLPFTLKELDRFARDNPLVEKAGRDAWINAHYDNQNIGKAIVRAKREKVRSLGWEPERFQYIHDQCALVLSLENIKTSISVHKKRMNDPHLYMGKEQAEQDYHDARLTMKQLTEEVAQQVSEFEQLLIRRLFKRLNRHFDSSVKTFASITQEP